MGMRAGVGAISSNCDSYKAEENSMVWVTRLLSVPIRNAKNPDYKAVENLMVWVTWLFSALIRNAKNPEDIFSMSQELTRSQLSYLPILDR
jgi:hypothetical protein